MYGKNDSARENDYVTNKVYYFYFMCNTSLLLKSDFSRSKFLKLVFFQIASHLFQPRRQMRLS